MKIIESIKTQTDVDGEEGRREVEFNVTQDVRVEVWDKLLQSYSSEFPKILTLRSAALAPTTDATPPRPQYVA